MLEIVSRQLVLAQCCQRLLHILDQLCARLPGIRLLLLLLCAILLGHLQYDERADDCEVELQGEMLVHTHGDLHFKLAAARLSQHCFGQVGRLTLVNHHLHIGCAVRHLRDAVVIVLPTVTVLTFLRAQRNVAVLLAAQGRVGLRF